MTADLIETTKAMMTPDVIAKAADSSGETPEAARKALLGAVPTVFAGLAHSAAAPGGAERLFGIIMERGSSGAGLMSKVFGERGGAVSDALAKSSGTTGASASRLLTLALPMVAGLLGKEIISKRMNPSGLAAQLFSHKKAILDDPNTPPGLAGALGVGSLSEIGGTAAGVDEPHVSSAAAPVRAAAAERAPRVAERPVVVAPKRHTPWGAIIPLLLLIGGLAVWGLFSPKHAQMPHVGIMAPQPAMPTVMPTVGMPRAPEAPAMPEPEVSAVPKAETPPGGEAPAMAQVTLPGGKTLDVEANSPEADMAHDLGDGTMSLPRTFQFSGLNFESGTATVSPDSSKTLDDLAAMLQSYPSSRVRIEGHTDSTGDPAANQTLSQARADATKEMLVARGIASDRIETAGNREHAPVADNETEEGRARNRRTDIVLINR